MDLCVDFKLNVWLYTCTGRNRYIHVSSNFAFVFQAEITLHWTSFNKRLENQQTKRGTSSIKRIVNVKLFLQPKLNILFLWLPNFWFEGINLSLCNKTICYVFSILKRQNSKPSIFCPNEPLDLSLILLIIFSNDLKCQHVIVSDSLFFGLTGKIYIFHFSLA